MLPPSLLVISQGWGLIDLPLRASNEHFLILYLSLRGVAEAALHCAHRATTASSWGLCEQEGHLAALPHLSKFVRFSLHRAAWLILDCARRTSTFLSCAFREQEDDQAARLPP
jgi:hypothetical protein